MVNDWSNPHLTHLMLQCGCVVLKVKRTFLEKPCSSLPFSCDTKVRVVRWTLEM